MNIENINHNINLVFVMRKGGRGGRRVWQRANDFTTNKPVVVCAQTAQVDAQGESSGSAAAGNTGPGAHLLSQVEKLSTQTLIKFAQQVHDIEPRQAMANNKVLDEVQPQFPLSNMTIPVVSKEHQRAAPHELLERTLMARQRKATAALLFNHDGGEQSEKKGQMQRMFVQLLHAENSMLFPEELALLF